MSCERNSVGEVEVGWGKGEGAREGGIKIKIMLMDSS